MVLSANKPLITLKSNKKSYIKWLKLNQAFQRELVTSLR